MLCSGNAQCARIDWAQLLRQAAAVGCAVRSPSLGNALGDGHTS